MSAYFLDPLFWWQIFNIFHMKVSRIDSAHFSIFRKFFNLIVSLFFASDAHIIDEIHAEHKNQCQHKYLPQNSCNHLTTFNMICSSVDNSFIIFDEKRKKRFPNVFWEREILIKKTYNRLYVSKVGWKLCFIENLLAIFIYSFEISRYIAKGEEKRKI